MGNYGLGILNGEIGYLLVAIFSLFYAIDFIKHKIGEVKDKKKKFEDKLISSAIMYFGGGIWVIATIYFYPKVILAWICIIIYLFWVKKTYSVQKDKTKKEGMEGVLESLAEEWKKVQEKKKEEEKKPDKPAAAKPSSAAPKKGGH